MREHSSTFKGWNSVDYIKSLEDVCDYFEIKQGRSKQYIKLAKEYFFEGKRSREHLLALNEASEGVDIYNLWKKHEYRFHGIKGKIRKCLAKGPLLQEHENPKEMTNSPRNDAFVYLIAGELIKANVNVLAVDGIVAEGSVCHDDADITIDCYGELIDIQCKRPQAERKFSVRYRKARNQILNTSREDQQGIIAIDCSSLIRPRENILNVNDSEIAQQGLDRLFLEAAKRNIDVVETRTTLRPQILGISIDEMILGLLLFARIPAVSTVYESRILSPLNNPYYSERRPDSFSILSFMPNINSQNISLLREVYIKLAESITQNN